MSTTRLEMFSDGVMAVIITVMVLELKTPHGPELQELYHLLPTFLTYILSFTVIGIYWNNHHHLIHVAKQVTTNIMWANLLLLFCLSLIPFFTAWLGEFYMAAWPTALYGIILLLAAFAYLILQHAIVASENENLKKNLGSDMKGKISLICYIAAVVCAFINPVISDILYAVVAMVWFIPDKRLVSAS